MQQRPLLVKQAYAIRPVELHTKRRPLPHARVNCTAVRSVVGHKLSAINNGGLDQPWVPQKSKNSRRINEPTVTGAEAEPMINNSKTPEKSAPALYDLDVNSANQHSAGLVIDCCL